MSAPVIKTSVVGALDDKGRRAECPWPAGWPPPREGETVSTEYYELSVRTVVWYPKGEDGSEPFVYVVLGPAGRGTS